VLFTDVHSFSRPYRYKNRYTAEPVFIILRNETDRLGRLAAR